MERLWTVYEAEEQRGIPYGALLRLIHAGKLRAVRLPGRRRFLIDRDDLDRLIEASKSGDKVDHQVDHSPDESAANSQQNRRPEKVVKSREFAPKPNWYKKFAVTD